MNAVRFAWLFCIIFIFSCNGVPRFANYIQDHMVLQRAPQRAIVWGFGDPNTLTTLTIDGKTYTTISESGAANAQNESIWSVTLDPVSDEGPFDIHVSQPLHNGTLVTITLHDVLFGDVWVCSGQSNMQMTLSEVFNGTEEIANAGNYPKIRVFTSGLIGSTSPVEELLNISLNWSPASPESVGGANWTYLSAVCWLYGRMIHTALNNRPIGLIATSFGGTIIEYWMPPKALQDCGNPPSIDVTIEAYDDLTLNAKFNYSALYNSMIYPFMRTVIYGVIWYQGESNAGLNADYYSCSFSKMIQYWRQIWNERTNGITDLEFPFGFVQLSTYINETGRIGQFPKLRWHQTFDVGYAPNHVVPKVFMAVACDLPDAANGIHPRFKHDIGYRLSRAGLAIAYGQQVEFQGPIVQNVTYLNGSPTLNITYTAVSSIELRRSDGFDVCCRGSTRCLDQTVWVPANISSKSDLTITLTIDSSCVGQDLHGLRYLWQETPCPFKQAAIYSGTDGNLPSPPYLKLF